ncbi:MAG: response regulator [Elusimicrobia bacterium]|nr:response regulator [Elusimicrobiota bacterium]
MREKILIADDDADNREIMRMALERAGYEIVLARDGREALEAARREKPALVLMDLSMPVLSGWEAVRRMKDDAALRAIPVLAFTAHAITGDETRAREAGCDGYLSKPCPPRLAVETVAAHLRARSSGATL